MKFHILNGDALAKKFPANLEGRVIVIREAFMDGPVTTEYTELYWTERAKYISDNFNTEPESYTSKFIIQLNLLDGIKSGDEVYLWFEDDLFCQVNMWFTVHYLTARVQPIFYRIFPETDDRLWKGFGEVEEEDLRNLYHMRQLFLPDDVNIATLLWSAYVIGDQNELKQLSLKKTHAMRFLPAVIEAHLARLHPEETERQPHKLLREIIHEENQSFSEVFAAFSLRAGIYGYGDLQIKNILRELDNKTLAEFS